MLSLAINGFGRIGKTFLRTVMLDPFALKKLNVAVINVGPGNPEHVAHLFKYDTIMRHYPGIVQQYNNQLTIDGHVIDIIAQTDPAKVNWKNHGVDWVVDCSGKFTKREQAQQHIQAGARAVLISAPAHDEDICIIPGVNEQQFDKNKHAIVSLGSCTTNAFAPLLKVLHDHCGFSYGAMTTVHAYTNSQALLDVDMSADLRRDRAAALNMVPTTTGAAQTVIKVIPELAGKISASALRVPVGNVSLIDLTFTAHKQLSTDSLNTMFANAAATYLKGILAISMEPLVSSDFMGVPYSVVVDGLLTTVNGPLHSVSGWYDNEWAYSMRMKDFLLSI